MEELSDGHKLFNLGIVGVSFFFVLSGFILTINYADLFRRGIAASGYTRFVWGRFSKIYPVHIATMLMALPIQIFSPHKPLAWLAVPIHTLLLQCWLPFSNPIFYNYLNVPSWSISCEWFFYLLAPPAMFCVLGSLRRRVLLLAFIALYVAALGFFLSHGQSDFTRSYFLNWFAPTRFLDFLAGIFLARAFLSPRAVKWAKYSVPAQIAGFVLLVAAVFGIYVAPWPLQGGLLFVPGAALLVFGLAYSRGLFAAHLSGPWLKRLGMASFSFYMLHTPMMRALKGVYYYFGWETHTWTGFWLVALSAYIVIQAAAFLMLYKFELPMQEWLRRLRARRIARAKTPATLEPSPNFENVRPLPVDPPLWEKRA